MNVWLWHALLFVFAMQSFGSRSLVAGGDSIDDDFATSASATKSASTHFTPTKVGGSLDMHKRTQIYLRKAFGLRPNLVFSL